MTLDDVKTLVEIVIAIALSGGIVGIWKRITNDRKTKIYKEENEVLKIQLAEKDRKINELTDTMNAVKEAVKASPEIAKEMLNYMSEVINK